MICLLSNLSTATALAPTAVSPACMFRRVRIIANGSCVVEDIADYSRVFQMFARLSPPQRRFGNMVEFKGGATQWLAWRGQIQVT